MEEYPVTKDLGYTWQWLVSSLTLLGLQVASVIEQLYLNISDLAALTLVVLRSVWDALVAQGASVMVFLGNNGEWVERVAISGHVLLSK